MCLRLLIIATFAALLLPGCSHPQPPPAKSPPPATVYAPIVSPAQTSPPSIPMGTPGAGPGKTVSVRPYYRKDGTYVPAHMRHAPGTAPHSSKP